MQVVNGMLAFCCLALGVLHLLRLATGRAERIGEASHAAMSLGMAVMFSPLPDPVPDPVWIVVFGAALAWFGVVAARARSLRGEPGHHVIGSVAMLFMVLAGHHGGEHAGHGGGSPVTSVVAILLAGYFAWHVLRCADRLRVGAPVAVTPDGAAVAVPAIAAPRTAALSHLVMAVGMTVMLLGMV